MEEVLCVAVTATQRAFRVGTDDTLLTHASPPPMKLRYLLPFAASILLIQPAPSISLPLRSTAVAARQVDYGSSDAVYQQVNPATVTVYAGREIGSGSIVSPDGLVITNYHVVNTAQRGQVTVQLTSGDRYTGQIIATDRVHDLALIQLEGGSSLPFVQLAVTNPQPGDMVFAIGSPYGQPGVMTSGTFSRVRPTGDLQSDVVLKPGNSGGPLLNARGELVGVNKAILQSRRGGNTGISFATSVADARALINQYRPGRLGTPAAPERPAAPAAIAAVEPWAGTRTPERFASPAAPWNQPTDSALQRSGNSRSSYVVPTVPSQNYSSRGIAPSRSGNGPRLGVVLDTRTMIIEQVRSGSVAALNGLQQGDRILQINGNWIQSLQELEALLSQRPTTVRFVISRNGQSQSLTVRF